MADFNLHKYFKTQYLQENDDPKMGAELEAGLDGTGVAENEEMGSKAQQAANAIDKALMSVDESLSYKDFAVAVARVLIDEYGQHNFMPFMEVLHAELGIKESLNEGFTPIYGTVTINGEKNVYTSSYQGKTDNLEDFLVAIDNIPNTVKSVKVVDQEFKASDKEGIKSKVKELATDDTDEFVIASFYGITKQDGDLNDPVYIDLKTPSSRQFGKNMAAGKYGSLD